MDSWYYEKLLYVLLEYLCMMHVKCTDLLDAIRVLSIILYMKQLFCIMFTFNLLHNNL